MTNSAEPAPSPVPAPVGTLASISLDCPNPAELADFYARLLGMQRIYEAPDGSLVALSNGGVALTMMRTPDHVRPTWPAPDVAKQMHLDVSVTDLDASVDRAVALGATAAGHEVAPHIFRVLIDPAGHPFCLTTVTL